MNPTMRPYESLRRNLDWMPPAQQVPAARTEIPAAVHAQRQGLDPMYLGKTRTVCGITTAFGRGTRTLGKTQGDTSMRKPPGYGPLPTGRTLRAALSDYFQVARLPRCTPASPSRWRVISADDYKRNLVSFGRFEVAGEEIRGNVPLEEFGPEQFKPYAESLAARSPTSLPASSRR